MSYAHGAAVLLATLALAAPAAVQAQPGDYRFSVRNDGRVTLNCRIELDGQSRHETVVLRVGETWTDRDARPRERSLYCDPPARAVRYRLRPGIAYHLVPSTRAVETVLRRLPAASF